MAIGCQGPRGSSRSIVYSGGDGSSCESAIVIRDAECREAGVLAERMWLAKSYPGYREATQSAVNSASKRYDVVEFATAGGETRKVYFDTTEFAGK